MGCQCAKLNQEEPISFFNSQRNLVEKSENGMKLKATRQKNLNTIPLSGRAKNYIEDVDEFKMDILSKINLKRKIHGVPELNMSNNISSISQKFAEHLAYIDELNYSGNTYRNQELGESVYQSSNKIDSEQLVNEWYKEIKEFDFNNNDPEPTNFSQMVWKSTQEVGIGIAKSLSGNYFYVMNYYPPGNISGHYLLNVFKENEIIPKIGKYEIIKEEVNGQINKKYENLGSGDL